MRKTTKTLNIKLSQYINNKRLYCNFFYPNYDIKIILLRLKKPVKSVKIENKWLTQYEFLSYSIGLCVYKLLFII